MFEYTLSVSLADDSLSINDPAVKDLLAEAVARANQSRNSIRKGRVFTLSGELDREHVQIRLRSNAEVIPTRALSSLSRALLAVDREGLVRAYRGCIFRAEPMEDGVEPERSNLSDVALMQTLTEMVFGQSHMRSNKDKELARAYTDRIRGLAAEYLAQKNI